MVLRKNNDFWPFNNFILSHFPFNHTPKRAVPPIIQRKGVKKSTVFNINPICDHPFLSVLKEINAKRIPIRQKNKGKKIGSP